MYSEQIQLELGKSYRADDDSFVKIVGQTKTGDKVKIPFDVFTGSDGRFYYPNGRSIQDLHTWSAPSQFSPRTLLEEVTIPQDKDPAHQKRARGDTAPFITWDDFSFFSPKENLQIEVGKTYIDEDDMSVTIKQSVLVDIGRPPYRWMLHLSEDNHLYNDRGSLIERVVFSMGEDYSTTVRRGDLVKEYGEEKDDQSPELKTVNDFIDAVKKGIPLIAGALSSLGLRKDNNA